MRRTLADYYHGYRDEFLGKSKRLLFDSDTLLWLVQEAARTVPGLAIEPYRGNHLVLAWKTGAQRTLFGFESGAHWKRWQAIAREAARCFGEDGAKSVFLRTAELNPTPGRWKIAAEIENAKSSYLASWTSTGTRLRSCMPPASCLRKPCRETCPSKAIKC